MQFANVIGCMQCSVEEQAGARHLANRTAVPVLGLWSVVVAAVLASATLPCAADTGVVIDSDTGIPIQGAYVYATWEGSVGQPNPVHNTVTRDCFDFAITQVGSNGKFVLSDAPAGRPSHVWGVERNVSAYAPGYGRSASVSSGRIALKSDKKDKAGRIRDLVALAPRCGSSDADQAKLVPLLAAVYAEALKLVGEEKSTSMPLRNIGGRLDRACLGSELLAQRMKAGEYRSGEMCKPGAQLVVQQRQSARAGAQVQRQSNADASYQRVKDLYDQLILHLKAGRIEPAVALFVQEDRARMREIFKAEGKALPALASSLGTVTTGQISGTSAQLHLVRKEAGGDYGGAITFSMGPDETWRINGF